MRMVDGKSLPYEPGEFDVVMSNSIVHHIPEPFEALREMRRVVRPGGLLFVRDLLRPDSEAEVERLVTLHAGEETPERSHSASRCMQP
ncbi:MAG: class I SAM-dependent methyltransferase [Planctomycetaceae bacterium]